MDSRTSSFTKKDTRKSSKPDHSEGLARPALSGDWR